MAYWAYCLRPVIRLDDDTLEIVNPWRRAIIPLAAVGRAHPGYSGISVSYFVDGRPHLTCAWAVQKANWSTWTGNETRADLVAAEITRRAQHAGHEPLQP